MSWSTSLMLVIAAAGAAVLIRFETFVLADLAHTPDDQLLVLSKWGWAAVCLLSLPFGSNSQDLWIGVSCDSLIAC